MAPMTRALDGNEAAAPAAACLSEVASIGARCLKALQSRRHLHSGRDDR